MIRQLSLLLGLIFLVLSLSINLSLSQPPEFTELRTVPGVKLYSNDFGDFMQVINLSLGASLKFLQGEVVGEGTPPAYNGKNPQFKRQTLEEFWFNLSEIDREKAFSVCNGQFFKGGNPTELAFPVQADGELISSGYAGAGEFSSEKVVFGMLENSAEIVPFLESYNFEQDSLPYINAIVGIREDGGVKTREWYSKAPFKKLPRTFLGVADVDRNGINETILILTAHRQTQGGADQLLKKWGAHSVMMLDGGGSTQLIVEGQELLYSTDSNPRTLPQAIGVLQGNQF